MRRQLRFLCLPALFLVCAVTQKTVAKEVETLKIGATAPELNLPGVDDKTYKLEDFKSSPYLVVIFTCNHCPTAQAYELRMIKLHDAYQNKGFAFVAISPNDPVAVRLDEMGYTDLGDTLEDMKIHAKRRGYKFPYLYDGETQRVSTAFGVLATPQVYIFDRDRKLRYNGRIDDNENGEEKTHDARNAIEDLLAGRQVATPTTRVFGCTTKWADKREEGKKFVERWDAEPVELKTIDKAALQELAANKTENFRLVSLWSTTCVPCMDELPDLVTVNRMYRRRHFEMYTLTPDSAVRREEALRVLTKYHVSCKNLIYGPEKPDELAEIIDPKWEGPLPYMVLIAPGGEIVKRWNDKVDPAELKTEISSRLGKTYASRK